MSPVPLKARKALRLAAMAALAAGTIAACTAAPTPTSHNTLDQQTRACAHSITSAAAGQSVITPACRDHPPSLAVLSAAQQKYNNLDSLVADLTAKLSASQEDVARLTEELEQSAHRTSQARSELLAAQDEVSTQTASRIRTNLETQAILEDSSIDIAGMTVGTVQSRISHATELEKTWMTRYLDLEERYNALRDLLSAETSELLTDQILLDQERAEFDRTVANAILTGTREERERLTQMQQEADTLHDAAQAAITQVLADMDEAARIASGTLPGTDQGAASKLRSDACQNAWTAIRLLTLSRTTGPAPLDAAWERLHSACTTR